MLRYLKFHKINLYIKVFQLLKPYLMSKTLSIILIILGFGAAAAMYFIGSTNSALSELLDFFYYALPIGGYGLYGLFRTMSRN